VSKFISPQNQNLVLLQIQKASSLTTASCFFHGQNSLCKTQTTL